MNERDSEAIGAILLSRGYELVDDEEDADILLINTCSVREQAERKAIGKIGILKRLKKEKPGIFIGVLGCMAQNMGKEILEQAPHVDFVLGTGQLSRLPDVIELELGKRERIVNTDSDAGIMTALGGHLDQQSKVSAFISIMRGCGHFCSYCVVPYVRGRERSRPPADVIDEASKLAEKGVKEIVLLGQNVAAYGLETVQHVTTYVSRALSRRLSGDSPFADLLGELNNIEGIARIRFTSPHPAYFNDKLIDAVAYLPKVCNNIHLPLQSGSDRILKLMNRHYSSEEYLEIVNKLKRKCPGITFSTDIIVGFPCETEEDFCATRGLMNEVGFDNAYIFKYSTRPGTAAAKMNDDVPQKVKEDRNRILLSDLKEMTVRHNKALVGEIVEILVEGPSKRNSSMWFGRTTTNKVVVFDPAYDVSTGAVRLGLKEAPSIRKRQENTGIKLDACSIGDMINLKITRSTPATLFGANLELEK